MSIRRLVVLSAVTALCCSSATAEDVGGQRVRIRLKRGSDLPPVLHCPKGRGESCPRVEGQLVAVAPDGALLVRREGQEWTPVAVPAAAVARLEVSEGPQPRGPAAGVGALAGGLLGAMGGLVYGISDSPDCNYTPALGAPGCFEIFTSGQRAAMGAALFGMAGAGIGALVGASLTGEQWRAVRGATTKPVRVSISPVRGRGISAAVTVAF